MKSPVFVIVFVIVPLLLTNYPIIELYSNKLSYELIT
jgi:hypothetical protein